VRERKRTELQSTGNALLKISGPGTCETSISPRYISLHAQPPGDPALSKGLEKIKITKIVTSSYQNQVNPVFDLARVGAQSENG
jgi:hypothetical protein